MWPIPTIFDVQAVSYTHLDVYKRQDLSHHLPTATSIFPHCIPLAAKNFFAALLSYCVTWRYIVVMDHDGRHMMVKKQTT